MNAVGMFMIPMKESESGYGEEEEFWKRGCWVGRCKKQEFMCENFSSTPQ